MFPKLSSEQGFQELLLHDYIRLGRHLMEVVVEGLKVVEGAWILGQELAKEGGSAPPGCRDKDVPDLVTILTQQCLTHWDGGDIQRFSQLIT